MMTEPRPEWRDGVPWCACYGGGVGACGHREPMEGGQCDDETYCAPAVGRLVEALVEIERRSEDPRAPFPAGVAFPLHCLEGINELARAALPPKEKR